MKLKPIAFAILILLILGCKQKVEESKKAIYDRNKGAHIVAPEMTKLLKDTLGIVMYELTIEPGDTLPWHEHAYHTAYILEGGTLKIIIEDRTVVWDFLKGRAALGPPFGDIAINTGETTFKVLMHELYSLDINKLFIGDMS